MSSNYLQQKQIAQYVQDGNLLAVTECVAQSKALGKYNIFGFEKIFNTSGHNTSTQIHLHSAVAHGHGSIVSYLLEQGCAINITDKDGRTPLYQAFANSQFEVAEQLIALGASIESQTVNGTRVFDMVLASGSQEWCDWFLQRGFKLEHSNKIGNTTLHYACLSPNVDLVKQVEKLSGFQFSQANFNGLRPLDFCTQLPVFLYALSQEPTLEMNIIFDTGTSSLHHHASEGSYDIVMYLLENGIDPCIVSKQKNGLMHFAVESGSCRLVAELVRRKVSVEGRNKVNYRPLHWAVANENLEMVRLLVENGKAKINIKGNRNFIIRETYTPLYLALDNEFYDIARYFIERGAELNALADQANRTAAVSASASGNLEILKLLLEKGASPNGVNRKSDVDCHPDFRAFPLACAANAATVNLLVEFGANVNAVPEGYMWRDSALRELVKRIEHGNEKQDREQGWISAVAALLAHGANLEDEGYGSILEAAASPEVRAMLTAEQAKRLNKQTIATPINSEL
jgi:ankyrin repeat protein